MKIMNAEEAARKSGYCSQDSSYVALESMKAINKAVDKQKEMSATVEFYKFKLTKMAIIEAANAFEKQGFKVMAQEEDSVIRLCFFWGPANGKHEVILPQRGRTRKATGQPVDWSVQMGYY